MKAKVYVETTIVSYLVLHRPRTSCRQRTRRSLGSGGPPVIDSISLCPVRSSPRPDVVMRKPRPAVLGPFGAFPGWRPVRGAHAWLRHLANAVLRGKIEEAVRAAGFVPPVICTPEELMEPTP
jgi:hypothetical protein